MSAQLVDTRLFHAGDVAWEVQPDWRDLQAAGDGLPIERWLREGRAVVVKQGAGRTVYRVDLPHRAIFVKHLRVGGLLQKLKLLFRRGACRREYEKARELARRGVPAIVPLALGERRRGAWLSESYLVTEAIPHACSLDEYVAGHLSRRSHSEQRQARKRLLDDAARLCAAAHAGGVFHDDLHGGNILVRIDRADADGPRLFLADLPGVRLSGPLDLARTRDSLAMLCAGFLGRTSNTDRLRFWRTYLAARQDLIVPNADRFAVEIREAAVAHARRIVRQRDKRAWADNRDFYGLSTPYGTAHAVRELPRTLIEQFLKSPERLWQANVDRPVKLSQGSLVVEAELRPGGREMHIAVKRLRPKNWWKALGRWLRRGRAPEAWYRGHALLARGIPTARPLAVYESKSSGLRREGYLLTEWLTGAQDVHLYGWALARRDGDERRRRVRQTSVALGRTVGRLHDQGFAHRDLKGNNLLLREQPDRVEAYLIDLDGLRRRRRTPFSLCCKNLTRLAVSIEMHPWVSRTDRLRFLREYLRQMPENRRTWKTWWRTIKGLLDAALGEIKVKGKNIT